MEWLKVLLTEKKKREKGMVEGQVQPFVSSGFLVGIIGAHKFYYATSVPRVIII